MNEEIFPFNEISLLQLLIMDHSGDLEGKKSYTTYLENTALEAIKPCSFTINSKK